MGRDKGPRKKLSFGSKFMLCLLFAALLGSVLVLGRLYGGAQVDLSKLTMQVLNIPTEVPQSALDDETPEPMPVQTAKQPAATEAPVKETGLREFRMTLAGTIALTGEVRKNSLSTDTKVTDYGDVMMLLSPAVTGEVKAVFLENLLSDRIKTNDNAAPASAAGLLEDAGFNIAACGFSQSYADGTQGIEDTLGTLESRDVLPLGIGNPEDAPVGKMTTVAGIKTAFLQYTGTISAKTRKRMEKEGTSGWVPEADPEAIAADIAAAREDGAEAVIVLLENGQNGREPDQKTKNAVQAIAEAGADLIVSNGSHVPQRVEVLTNANGKEVLWAWSLGTLLDGDRSNIRHMSGYLLHVTVRSDGQGGVQVLHPEYTPVYTWKYKQDGRFYYRCVISDGEAPDGMDSEQLKNMARSAETVAAVLRDTVIRRREDNP